MALRFAKMRTAFINFLLLQHIALRTESHDLLYNALHLEDCEERYDYLFSFVPVIIDTMLPRTVQMTIVDLTQNHVTNLLISNIQSVIPTSILITNKDLLEAKLESFHSSRPLLRSNVYLVTFYDKKELHYLISHSRASFQGPTNAIFLLIDLTYINRTENNFEFLLRECWMAKMLNVMFLTIVSSDNERYCYGYNSYGVMVATWNPFLNATTMKIITRTELRGLIIENFLNTKVLNLNGYRLTTTNQIYNVMPSLSYQVSPQGVVKTEGYFHTLLQTFASVMNFSMTPVAIYNGSAFSTKLQNGSWSQGVIRELVDSRVDLAYSAFLMTEERFQEIGLSTFVTMQPYVVLIKKADLIPKWMALLQSYDQNVWLLILILFMVFCLATWLCQKLETSASIGGNLSDNIMGHISVLLAISVKQPNTVAKRILFFSWVYFSLIITAIFQGRLVSFLTKPQYLDDMDTFSDLADSDFAVYGYAVLKGFLNDKSDKVLLTLSKRFHPIYDLLSTVKRVLTEGNVAVVSSKQTIEYALKTIFNCHQCSRLYHYLEENFGAQIIGFATPLSSPYMSSFNFLTRKLHEGGLIQKWYDNILYEMELVNTCEQPCDQDSEIVLSLHHMQAPFCVLVSGYTIAFCTFLVATLWRTYKQYVNKR